MIGMELRPEDVNWRAREVKIREKRERIDGWLAHCLPETEDEGLTCETCPYGPPDPGGDPECGGSLAMFVPLSMLEDLRELMTLLRDADG